MKIVFFDNNSYKNLLPLTYTRPAADLRIGLMKISEKWEIELNGSTAGYHTQDHLISKFSTPEIANLYIASNFLPNATLTKEILNLKEGETLRYSEAIIAYRTDSLFENNLELEKAMNSASSADFSAPIISIESPKDIFKHNGAQITEDVSRLNLDKTKSFGTHNTLIGDQFYIHPSVKMEGVILNSTYGPIVLDKDVEIMEGAVIRGPFAALEHSTVKMSSKIYGDTTIGPHCKVGGEVGNSVFYGYSNKGHDGYLGNSVIGEWCNLGADTNSSNLKNNYSEVSAWNYDSESIEPTGETFVGVIMGDHSKTGINTMLNTGTVVGVSANIYGGDFPPKFIPSFSWGGSAGFQTFNLDKAKEVASKMMQRRKLELSSEDSSILDFVYHADSKFRK